MTHAVVQSRGFTIPESIPNLKGKSFPLNDQKLLIAMGAYDGITARSVFGRNRNCADGTEEEIFSVEAAAVFPATALMTSLSQTTDAAGLQGENVIITGLDINWNESIQTVALNASNSTTAVTLGTALLRVNDFRMRADTIIATTVRLHNAAENQDYAIILVGEERATQAHFSVPLGFTAYMTGFWAKLNESAVTATDIVDIQLYSQDFAHADAPRQTLVESFQIVALPDSGAVSRKFSPYLAFGPRTDIVMTAEANSTVADVSAGFDLILVEDALYNS